MKRLTTFLTALFATTALGAYDFSAGDLYYNITSSTAPYTAEVTCQELASSNNYKGLTSAIIPTTVTNGGIDYTVTGVGYCAFYKCSSLASVTLPNSVTTVGAYAFYSCTNLTAIAIPNSVTSVGEKAFLYCTNLDTVTIGNGVTTIGGGAFYKCESLKSIVFPYSLTSIGYEAFSGCTGLADITIYAMTPPTVENDSTFENYSATLRVPSNSYEAYHNHAIWGKFRIDAISATDVETADKVTVEPSTNSAVLTWPSNAQASTYTIVISNGDVTFCTLAFNAEGKLTNISYAPSADGTAPNRVAEVTISGFRFTITGLEEGSTYTYSVTAKDADGNPLYNYTGEFTTNATTALHNVEAFEIYTENGRIACEQEFQIFDLFGRNVTRLNGSLNGVYIVKVGDKAQKVVVSRK